MGRFDVRAAVFVVQVVVHLLVELPSLRVAHRVAQPGMSRLYWTLDFIEQCPYTAFDSLVEGHIECDKWAGWRPAGELQSLTNMEHPRRCQTQVVFSIG